MEKDLKAQSSAESSDVQNLIICHTLKAYLLNYVKSHALPISSQCASWASYIFRGLYVVPFLISIRCGALQQLILG